MISPYTEADDQLTFEFIDLTRSGMEDVSFEGAEEGTSPDEEPTSTDAQSDSAAAAKPVTNKMIVIQTKEGVFLRFRLSEVPEKKKGAVGVRGINLGKDDAVDKIYILGFGEKTTIHYRSKDVELMKLKLAKRGLKGTKIRV